MEFKVNEECGGKISFEISNFITLCPHRKYDEEDITELKLTYKPGKFSKQRSPPLNLVYWRKWTRKR